MSSALRIMEDYTLLRLKRKDLEEFSDDFSEFSLSSPARKIRRLGADLPPIVEEEESEMPFVSEYSTVEEPSFGYNSETTIKIEELSSEPLNEERAIVLFNPNSTASISFIPSSPPNYIVSVSPQILSRTRNHVLHPRKSNILMGSDDEEAEVDASGPDSNSLAVIPWAPPSQPSFITEPENSDMMDAQFVGPEEAMDVEDNAMHSQSSTILNGDGFHRWQQQHWLAPHPLQNTSSPVGWYR